MNVVDSSGPMFELQKDFDANSFDAAVSQLTVEAVSLSRVTETSWDDLREALQGNGAWLDAGFEQQPSDEHLAAALWDDGAMLAWRLGGEHGFIGVSAIGGPPFVFFLPTGEVKLEAWREGTWLLCSVFFRFTLGDELWLYLEHPVPELVHAEVVALGFDLWPEVKDIDPEHEVAYMMERATWDSYREP